MEAFLIESPHNIISKVYVHIYDHRSDDHQFLACSMCHCGHCHSYICIYMYVFVSHFLMYGMHHETRRNNENIKYLQLSHINYAMHSHMYP